jgi:hypothetical protein
MKNKNKIRVNRVVPVGTFTDTGTTLVARSDMTPKSAGVSGLIVTLITEQLQT